MEFKTSMTTSTANNPLAKHFRQPAIFLRLPSGGRFWPTNSIELSLTNEIPVYPMTVKDELMLKTPDALMNGASMVEMIRSCCPDIKDPWACPVVDLDAILIAIRLASYGDTMDFETVCPHCQTKNDNAIDLRVLLDNIKPVGYNSVTVIDGLTFKFKPQNFNELNLVSLATFEQQRLISSIMDSTIDDAEKATLFKEGFSRLTDLNLDMIASCIHSVKVDDAEVTNREQITEFLVNTDRKIYEEIKTKIEQTVAENKIDALALTCNECEKEYQTNLEFNQSNFFG
jgi:hypothetical protein